MVPTPKENRSIVTVLLANQPLVAPKKNKAPRAAPRNKIGELHSEPKFLNEPARVAKLEMLDKEKTEEAEKKATVKKEQAEREKPIVEVLTASGWLEEKQAMTKDVMVDFVKANYNASRISQKPEGEGGTAPKRECYVKFLLAFFKQLKSQVGSVDLREIQWEKAPVRYHTDKKEKKESAKRKRAEMTS